MNTYGNTENLMQVDKLKGPRLLKMLFDYVKTLFQETLFSISLQLAQADCKMQKMGWFLDIG